jgi:hypothetical protein
VPESTLKYGVNLARVFEIVMHDAELALRPL